MPANSDAPAKRRNLGTRLAEHFLCQAVYFGLTTATRDGAHAAHPMREGLPCLVVGASSCDHPFFATLTSALMPLPFAPQFQLLLLSTLNSKFCSSIGGGQCITKFTSDQTEVCCRAHHVLI